MERKRKIKKNTEINPTTISIENAILNFFNSPHLRLNKDVVNIYGIDVALWVADVFSRWNYFNKKNKLEDGYFFVTQEEIKETTKLNRNKQTNILKFLEEEGIISIRKKGTPCKNWYKFNVINLVSRVNDSSLRVEDLKPKLFKSDATGCLKSVHIYNKNNYNKNNYNKNNKDIYTFFLDSWNEQKIIVHSKITSKRKKVIDKILKNKDYSIDEIIESFQNYATVLNSPDYYFSHKWTMEDFLVRGLDRFVSESDPLKVFSNKSQVGSMKNDNQSNNNILSNPSHESLHLFPVEKKDLFLEEIKTVTSKWMNVECFAHGYKPSKFKIYEALLKQKVWLNNLMTGDDLHKVTNWENRVFNSTARRNLGTLTQLSDHYFEWIDNEGQGIALNNEQILFPDSKTFKRFILIESDILGVDIESRGWGEYEHLCIDTPKEKIQRCIDNAEELENKYIIKEKIEDNKKENTKWAENCIMKVLSDYEMKINNINSNWFNEHITDFIGGRKNDGTWKTKLKEVFIEIEKKYQLDPKMRKNGYLSSFYNLQQDTIQEILKPTFVPYEKCYHDLEDRRKIYELNTIKDDESDF